MESATYIKSVKYEQELDVAIKQENTYLRQPSVNIIHAEGLSINVYIHKSEFSDRQI